MTDWSRFERNLEYQRRARRIVERVMPALQFTPNPLASPTDFMAATQYSAERTRLYWRTIARLRAKAEGGRPYLDVPKGDAMIGSIMHQVAKELEAERTNA